MDKIRYLHAADLHLDTPFSGLGKNFAPWADRLRNATFTALDRLTELALARKPDFLVLAGDIYNQEERSIRAQLKLRDMCVAVGKQNIPVFIIHGNHDPYSSRFTSINWPDNTFIFGIEPEAHPVKKDGETIAIIHGASHASDHEDRDFTKYIKRDASQNCFQLGLLHCNVDGSVANDRYAPCSLQGLMETGMDAFALGHAHLRRILSQSPFIAYSGNTQGLHINETGPKGCLEVIAERKGKGWQCESRFHELGPCQWQSVDVSLENVASFDEVETRLIDAMQGAIDGSPESLILDIKLTGRTSLAAALGEQETMADLVGRLQPFTVKGTEILLRDMAVETAPLISEEENLERDDLLGEISRLAKKLEDNGPELAGVVQEAIGPVLKACRGALVEPDESEQAKLLARARRICQDMLERR